MRPSSICRKLTLFASSVALASLSCQALAQHSNIDRVVFFGTSLSDTGNAFIWLSTNKSCGTSLNVPPYDALDEFSVPDGPYAMGGHHFTNGATWAEGLARYLALAGNARPALQNRGTEASNYAVGGARAFANYPCRFNLPAQVSGYLTDFPQTSARSLVAIEIGGNDVRDALVAAVGGQNPDPYIERALLSLGDNIARLRTSPSGASKFLLLNVPDLGKAPAVRILGPNVSGLATGLSFRYNVELEKLVENLLKGGCLGCDIRILDIYTKLNEIVASPGTYGFTNVTDACVTPNQPPFKCAEPDTYVFWDGIHPTKAVHAIVAQLSREDEK